MGGIEISAVSVSFLLLIPFQVLAMDFGAGAVLQSAWGDASSHPTTLGSADSSTRSERSCSGRACSLSSTWNTSSVTYIYIYFNVTLLEASI